MLVILIETYANKHILSHMRFTGSELINRRVACCANPIFVKRDLSLHNV